MDKQSEAVLQLQHMRLSMILDFINSMKIQVETSLQQLEKDNPSLALSLDIIEPKDTTPATTGLHANINPKNF